MARALLVVDRGSREPEVELELEQICNRVKVAGNYNYSTFCFLEVRPPSINEGIAKCIQNGCSLLTVVPYFLYPGKKLRDAVKNCAQQMSNQRLSMVITKPLSYHALVADLTVQRIGEAKAVHGINLSDNECDILLIGHGSSDRSAREAFLFAARSILPRYRNVTPCFLELDQPDIKLGVELAASRRPHLLIIMPYFLHRGAHVKSDILRDLENALSKHSMNHIITAPLGVDEKIVKLVISRSAEAEARADVFRQ